MLGTLFHDEEVDHLSRCVCACVCLRSNLNSKHRAQHCFVLVLHVTLAVATTIVLYSFFSTKCDVIEFCRALPSADLEPNNLSYTVTFADDSSLVRSDLFLLPVRPPQRAPKLCSSSFSCSTQTQNFRLTIAENGAIVNCKVSRMCWHA